MAFPFLFHLLRVIRYPVKPNAITLALYTEF